MPDNQTRHFTIVIFGASGDLPQRKLAPALFHLHAIGALPERCRFVAFARSELNDESYRRLLFEVSTDDFASDMQSLVGFRQGSQIFSRLLQRCRISETTRRLHPRRHSRRRQGGPSLLLGALPHSLRRHCPRLGRCRHVGRNQRRPTLSGRKTLRHRLGIGAPSQRGDTYSCETSTSCFASTTISAKTPSRT